jgi:hydrogenase maturation protein HypF
LLVVMVSDVAMAREFCQVSLAEERMLASSEAPIVLLRPRNELFSGKISSLVAPQNSALGVMLPYTPLHHLLLQTIKAPLVMTSGNWPGEPLCTSNEDAWLQLRPMCDGFLLHNRPIAARCDDSVSFVADVNAEDVVQPVRRSRGFVPVPVLLPASLMLAHPLVAVGADLKNVSAVAAERAVFMTQHIGDLEKLAIRMEQAQAIADFEQLFNIRPQAIVCDLHPDYASSHYAQERAKKDGLPLIEVQHHHAHIAGCLAENDRSGPAIGLAFDGTGYGTDGRIWGGEILLADLADFERQYHLEYLPLPGGEAAIIRPYRAAIAYLLTLCPHVNVPSLFPHIPLPEFKIIETMLAQNLNTPLTSSMGRLFDVVSAMLGLCNKATYEAQAAIALEAAAWQSSANGRYYFSLEEGQIRLGRLLFQISADRLRGAPVSNIARRFHNTVAAMAVFVAERVRSERNQVLPVALSGGVWQNRLLLEMTVKQLRQANFEVLLHRQVPANDGGLAYGQTAVAAARLKEAA